jgi:methionine-rich copper-binding protein CopC
VRFSYLTVGILAATILALLVVGMASAHAKVNAIAWDNPASPTKLNATAVEHISNTPGTYYLRVYNASNVQVDLGDTTINPADSTKMSVSVNAALPSGFYRVDWGTLSADDGHSDSGTLYISLGTDPDSDGVQSTADNCPWWPNASQTAPAWSVPSGDSDCDGFGDTASGSRASETFVGTNPTMQCAATATQNDEPLPDAWPMDMNDDQLANGQDILKFNPVFGGVVGDGRYKARFDVKADGIINGQDILTFNPFFGKFCSTNGH